MIQAIDQRFVAVFGALLRVLCKTTGKDNFFFTRIMSFGSVILSIIAAVLYGRKVPTLTLVVPALIAVGMLCTNKVGAAEHRLKVSLDQFPFTVKEVAEVRVMRFLTLILTTIAIWMSAYIWQLGMLVLITFLSMSMAHYFILDLQPKTKGPIKRAITWLRMHRPRLPRILPNPSPG